MHVPATIELLLDLLKSNKITDAQMRSYHAKYVDTGKLYHNLVLSRGANDVDRDAEAVRKIVEAHAKEQGEESNAEACKTS
jgi:hypothetical protein